MIRIIIFNPKHKCIFILVFFQIQKKIPEEMQLLTSFFGKLHGGPLWGHNRCQWC